MNGRKPSSLVPASTRRGKSGLKGDATSGMTAKIQIELRPVLASSRALPGGRCRCDFRRAHAGEKAGQEDWGVWFASRCQAFTTRGAWKTRRSRRDCANDVVIYNIWLR